jgi:secretion/DNA translocation related TadE-like protein
VNTRFENDRGSATLLALFVTAALSGAMVLGLGLTEHLFVKQQMTTAADLAAIAAAQSLDDPCSSARRVVVAHDVTLIDCHREGDDWHVTVTRPGGDITLRVLGWFGQGWHLTQTARAGF